MQRGVRESGCRGPAARWPTLEELWFLEERADVADWLGEHGWQVTATEARAS